MPTVVIHGLPSSIRGTRALQDLALETIPGCLAAVEGLRIGPGFVTVFCPADLIVRVPRRIIAFVHDLYDTPERTATVRAAAAQAILECLVDFAASGVSGCDSIQVYLGTHKGESQGRASWSPPLV